ncbi:MAG TPA: hypothetical protein VEE84_04610, partial [Burkholderiaceae bacterium]|nr:hypothetical protein [Burkholderiaceae bacterium]
MRATPGSRRLRSAPISSVWRRPTEESLRELKEVDAPLQKAPSSFDRIIEESQGLADRTSRGIRALGACFLATSTRPGRQQLQCLAPNRGHLVRSADLPCSQTRARRRHTARSEVVATNVFAGDGVASAHLSPGEFSVMVAADLALIVSVQTGF